MENAYKKKLATSLLLLSSISGCGDKRTEEILKREQQNPNVIVNNQMSTDAAGGIVIPPELQGVDISNVKETAAALKIELNGSPDQQLFSLQAYDKGSVVVKTKLTLMAVGKTQMPMPRHVSVTEKGGLREIPVTVGNLEEMAKKINAIENDFRASKMEAVTRKTTGLGR